MPRTSDYPLVATLCLTIASVALLAACGGGDEAGPQASDVPSGAVAVVGDEEVSQQDLDTRTAALRRSQSKGTRLAKAQLEQQALSQLLYDVALAQEARARGVKVTDQELRAHLAAAKRRFPNRAAYRRFLGKQTEADLVRNLRQQLTTEKLLENAGDGKEQKAISAMQKRWREKTSCAEEYVTIGCGNASG